MTTLVPLAQVTDAVRGGVISIGNFDGVHRGHAALLARVRQLADRLGGPAVAVALDPHPAVILRPERAPAKLSWLRRRAELMAPIGIDALVVCETSPEFLQRSASSFFDWLVRERLRAAGMVEGPNFYFGHRREGDVPLLRSLCDRHGVALEIVPPTEFPDLLGAPDGGATGDSAMVSSTRIRGLIAEGEVEQAARLLGHPHRLRGQVVDGDRRGRTIGFPTANLADIDVLVPAPGVYGGRAVLQGSTRPAAIHIGPRPTFETAGPPQVEVHLLDFQGDLYGQTLLVDVICRVRDIAKFDSLSQLAEQLARDVDAIRQRLDESSSESN